MADLEVVLAPLGLLKQPEVLFPREVPSRNFVPAFLFFARIVLRVLVVRVRHR